MTPEEFKSTRLMWGLTQEWVAKQLGVTHSSVANWENGKHKINPEAIALITFSNNLLENIIETSLDFIDDLLEENDGPFAVNLVGYHTTEDLHKYRPDMMPFPCTTHNIMLIRTKNEMAKMDVEAKIVFLEPEQYEAWLKLTGKKDSETSRAEWAGLID